MSESQTGVYKTDMASLSNDFRRTVSEENLVVTVTDVGSITTHTLENGETLLMAD